MVRDYGDDIQFIGMAGLDSTGPMEEFVADYNLGDIPHTVDGNGQLWAHFGVPYQPSWVFIDSGGETEVHAGPLAEDELRATLDALRA